MHRLVVPLAGIVLSLGVALSGCESHDTISEDSGLTVHRLRCEYLDAPMGIDTREPRLSWALESKARDQRQSAYQILVASTAELLAARHGDLWDSGKVESSQSTHIPYAGTVLKSGQQCYWAVRVWNGAGVESPWSAQSRFELGLLDPSDWTGEWIGGKGLLRKEFELSESVITGRAYVAAIGYYVLYVNGERVGDEQLLPGQSDYTKRALYMSHDVSRYLRTGRNVVAIELGKGWLHPGLVRDGLITGYPEEPCVLVQLNFTAPSGAVTTVSSDASWQSASGPIVEEQLNVGEVYDARLERPGWSQPGYSAPDLESARVVQLDRPTKLASLKCQPDRVTDVLSPRSIAQPEPGVWVVDFGQNFAGWVRLRVQGPSGTRVEMKFAEKLGPNGRLDEYTTYNQKDVYILKGEGRETWRPKFTWHGFRYVEVTGFPGEPTYDDFAGEVVHSDVAPAGRIGTNHDLLNAIQRATLWTQRSNMHGGVPSDCPHRERLGYGGDGQVCAEMAIHNFDMAPFYSKWLDDLADAQHSDGFVPNTAPSLGGGGGPAWGCAYVIIPWQMYRYYGDTRILERHYDGMKRWVEFLAGKTADHIVQPYGSEWEFLGDWCPPDRGQDTDKWKDQDGAMLMSTFYYHMVVDILGKTAEILERKEDAKAYKERAEAIKEAFNRKFYNPAHGFYHAGLQADNVFALAGGMTPEQDVPAVIDHVVKDIEARDMHLDTGIFGTKYLLEVLTQHGRVDEVYDLATQFSYPSWGYMLEKGATTLWEQWNGVFSNNHPMFGTISEWFYKGLAGIRVDDARPGYEHVVFAPSMPLEMRRANGSLDTLRGEIVSSWRRTGRGYMLAVTLPANSPGTVHLPRLGSGNMRVTVDDQAVWDEDAFVEGVKGIHHAREGERDIVVEIGSGRYEFSVTFGR